MSKAEAKTYSQDNKDAIKRDLDQILERDMKPVLLVRRKGRPAFGAITDVYTKWHGHGLILIAKRRGGTIGNRKLDEYESKSGRITIVGADRYSVAYFRHTGQWWTFASDCNLKSALAYFRKPSPVWPY